MRTPAAVLVELNQPLALLDLEIPPLQAGQVLVEVAFSGVCHTQLSEVKGRRGPDPYLPHCLGHEGSGWVREVGAGVNKVRPGDAVVLSWIKASGANVPGTVYRHEGRSVNAGGITTFSRHAVISENRLTPVPAGLTLEQAALLGCAVPTGVGTVLNTAAPRAGESLAVMGVGGVGLCAVAAAVVCGCHPVIAVDVLASKLDLARQMGATHTIDASTQNVLAELQQLCPGGLDFAIECSGRPEVMQQALLGVRAQGGTAVVVGNAPHGSTLAVDPGQLNQGKRLLGTWGGDNEPDRDYPRYGRLMAAGRLPLAPLLGRTYPLAAVNEALADLERGAVARSLLDMRQAP